jgi:CRP-like cAMP-binding protein
MNAPNGPVARRLRAIEVFSDLRDEELAFLAELATVVELEPGGVLRSRGDPADVMFAVLDGEMRSRLEEGDSDGRLFVRRPGQVGAMLPHSRLTHFPGTIRAAVRTTLACFAKADFPAMLERIPVLEQRLASVMADRVRETTHFELHRERLAGLGKLAAGLAHELNNPISAIQRAAAEMGRSTEDLAEVARELLRAAVGDAVLQRVETLGAGADGRTGSAVAPPRPATGWPMGTPRTPSRPPSRRSGSSGPGSWPRTWWRGACGPTRSRGRSRASIPPWRGACCAGERPPAAPRPFVGNWPPPPTAWSGWWRRSRASRNSTGRRRRRSSTCATGWPTRFS